VPQPPLLPPPLATRPPAATIAAATAASSTAVANGQTRGASASVASGHASSNSISSLPVPPLLRTWHAFALKTLHRRATTITLDLLTCSLSFDKTLGFGERHRAFGLAHLADIIQGGAAGGAAGSAASGSSGSSGDSTVNVVFHTPQNSHSDGTVPSTLLQVPAGIFEEDDDPASTSAAPGDDDGDGAPVTLASQTQVAAAINAPGPAGVGSSNWRGDVSVYKKCLQFASAAEAAEFVDLVMSVRLTGASVGVLAASGASGATLRGNPAVQLFLELDVARRGAISLPVLRQGLQRVVVGEMGAEAAQKASVPTTEGTILHPWVVQLTAGAAGSGLMRSCTLSRFLILYGRLLTLFHTPSAATSLLNGSSVAGAFRSGLGLGRLSPHMPSDFVPVQPPQPPKLLEGEELLEQQPRAWLLVEAGARGGNSSSGDAASSGAGAGNGATNSSGSGLSGVCTRVRGCFFLTDYRLIFMPYDHHHAVPEDDDAADADKEDAQFIELPLGTLSRVEQPPKKELEALSSFLLSFHSKDILRVLHVGFDAPKAWVDLLAKMVSALAFPRDKDQTKLFAFTHRAKRGNKEAAQSLPPERDGWNLFDPLREYARLGLVTDSGKEVPGRHFRLSYFNLSYEACPSYPRVLCLPSSVTDEQLTLVAKFRSSGRLPAVVWRHPRTGASLSRCSQPLAGMRGKRCLADEQLIAALRLANPHNPSGLYVMDARPYKAAVGNAIMGKGVENASDYPGIQIHFLGIENIHAIRNSHVKLADVLVSKSSSAEAAAAAGAAAVAAASQSGQSSSSTSVAGGTSAAAAASAFAEDLMYLPKLHASNWLGFVRLILASSVRMVSMLAEEGVSVLVHCSDGWDRTSQLCSLVELMLDPFYRTRAGFAVLVEKEWLSFGHQFALRHGHADPDYTHEQRAPIFLQWLDCVWQVWRQHPSHFEFTEAYLLALVDAVHSCRFGTFLFNSERERHAASLNRKTVSVWTHLIDPANAHLYLNSARVNGEAMAYRACGSSSEVPPVIPSTAAKHMLVWEANYLRFEQGGPKRPLPRTVHMAAGAAGVAEESEKEKELQRYHALRAKLKQMGLSLPELDPEPAGVAVAASGPGVTVAAGSVVSPQQPSTPSPVVQQQPASSSAGVGIVPNPAPFHPAHRHTPSLSPSSSSASSSSAGATGPPSPVSSNSATPAFPRPRHVSLHMSSAPSAALAGTQPVTPTAAAAPTTATAEAAISPSSSSSDATARKPPPGRAPPSRPPPAAPSASPSSSAAVAPARESSSSPAPISVVTSLGNGVRMHIASPAASSSPSPSPAAVASSSATSSPSPTPSPGPAGGGGAGTPTSKGKLRPELLGAFK